MLTRNSHLLSEEVRLREAVLRGYVLSILTHVAVPELDFSVHEGCRFPGCVVERAQFRCGRCFVARYCGNEHMTADWREHKMCCVPLAQRQPAVTLDCADGYLDDPRQRLGIDCITSPRKTFPGVVVVKISMAPFRAVKICDVHGVLALYMGPGSDGFDRLEPLLRARTRIEHDLGCGYFDADMTVEGRLIVFMDRTWKCTW
jgi:hypothetical protein